MTDIAAISRGLTKLDASALRDAIKDGQEIWCAGSNFTCTRLRERELVRGMGRLTPLGLRVRAFLRGEGNG